jgi:hypothetical protein
MTARPVRITDDQLKAMIEDACRDAVRSELENAGLVIQEADHRSEARKDFTFLRAWRMRQDRLANAIGNAILAVVGLLVVAVLGLAARAAGLRWPE